MNAMVFAPIFAISQMGLTLLLAASLLAAALGVVAFIWAIFLVWRENNPPMSAMRGQRNSRGKTSARQPPQGEKTPEIKTPDAKTLTRTGR